MHQALYRKYRPQTFDEVIGQEHITKVLSWEVANHKVNHAYVFCGSAGTGKTSCAKILAKAVNCENPKSGNPCNSCHSCKQIDAGASMEVIEMDAASNTGVDYIRDIKEDVVFTPSEQGIKVYIIDEVHMLSESAFNALLKTLEEPPQNVIFVLATTEIQDIPATILSRCQRFDFKRLTTDDVVQRLNYIAEQESYALEKEAAVLLAHLSKGGMRDAVSLFELCLDQKGFVTEQSVRDAAGIVGIETIVETVRAIIEHKADALFEIVADIHRSSKDLSIYFRDLITFYRDMLVQKVLKIKSYDMIDRQILDLSAQNFKDISALSEQLTKEKIVYHIKVLEEAYITMHKSDVKRITAEITLMRLALSKYDSSLEALEARISDLEAGQIPISVSQPTQPKAPPKSEKQTAVASNKTPARDTLQITTLSEWIDIIEAYAAKDPSTSSFLKNTKATFNKGSGELTVWTPDGFAVMMLNNDKTKDTIKQFAARFGISAITVTITLKPKGAEPDDPLSDLV